MPVEKHIQPWEVLDSQPGPDLIIFKVRYDQVRNPHNGFKMKAVVLKAPEWVNVVALTPKGKVVVVEQHRFGIGRPTLEIPAGLVEHKELPLVAAMRELEEETGYATSTWEPLGSVQTNPAFLDNHCHFWLARDVTRTREVHLDSGEEIAVSELSIKELRHEIEKGNMRNSLCLLALSRVFDLRKVKL